MEFAERLKALRLRLRLTQEEMAARLRVSKNYVWQMEKGTKPGGPKIEEDIELMEKAAAGDSTRPAGGDVMRDVQFIRLRYIPVVAWARAGSAIAYDTLPTEHIDRIPADVADPKAFAIKVRGDSMEPDIREGDCAILLPSEEARSGDVAAVLFQDGTMMIKQVQFSRDRTVVTLISYNPEYKPKEVPMEEVSRIVPVHASWKPIRGA